MPGFLKNLICLTRHKAKWLCLGYRKGPSTVADWQCTACDRQWASEDLTPIACVGCVRLFHREGLDDAPRGEQRCAACTFREDYVKAVAGEHVQLIAPQTIETEYGMAVMTPPGTPYYPPGKDNPRPPPYVFGMPAPEKPVDNSGQAQQFAVRAAVTQSGEQLIGRRTGGAFHFTGRGAGPPKPADKVQPSDSSYSNLPHPRAILRGRAKDAE